MNAKTTKKGLSLIELMIAVAILVFSLSALLASYSNIFLLADLARDRSRAANAVRAKMEELKKENFSNLDSFNATTFNLDGFSANDAKGRIEVRTVTGTTDLKEIRVVASFRSRRRIIGEDTNLNGVLNTGEDANNNGRLDSPVELVTLFVK
jgi:prepilin-type N-terminal cleavage/methylation domain-containing protein